MISIILPVYIIDQELLDLTKATYASIQQTDWDGEKAEIICIDDGSTMGQDFLQANSDIYIKGKVNHGYPWAVNKGIQASSGDLVVFGNNDIRVSPNWLKIAKEVLTKDSMVASLHFRMTDYDTPIEVGNDIWTDGKERWCTSSFYVIKREAIPEELYDENFGWGGYDDYCWWHRVRDINGWQQAYTNKAVYQHKHSSTQNKRNREQWDLAQTRNREYYKSKYGEYPDIAFLNKFPAQMQKDWWPYP